MEVFISVGSNLGDRKKNIRRAIKKIDSLKDTKVIKVSRLIETEPKGGPQGQPKFLNGVLKIKTCISPLNLLKKLKRIEKELGRKETVRFGPRIIDLDILLYGDKVIIRKNLKIPHPRMFEREFVLRPLWELI